MRSSVFVGSGSLSDCLRRFLEDAAQRLGTTFRHAFLVVFFG